MLRCTYLLSLITSTVFLAFFASPRNGFLFCEAAHGDSHNSIKAPRAFIPPKKKTPPSPLDVSLLSRGGAAMNGVSPRLEGGASDRSDVAKKVAKNGAIHWIQNIPRAKLGWAISFAINLVYLVVFLSPTETCKFSQDGFCVFNYDGEKCPANDNSHFFAWRTDLIFTILAFVVGALHKANIANVLGIAAVILSHGFLHKVLSDSQCQVFDGGAGLFAIFTAFICFFILTGSGSLGGIANIAITLLMTALTLGFTAMGKGVSGIFLITQLLASGTASFFPKEGAVTQLMGDTFILPCIVSLVEILNCCNSKGRKGWFYRIGGHVWYDFFLHISVVASLIPEKTVEE